MIRATTREWSEVRLGEVGGREGADRLLRVAAQAQDRLGLGGEAGERILVNRIDRLKAQQVVGVIAASGVSLEILPKIDDVEATRPDGEVRRNLVRMLARTLGVAVADGELTSLGVQADDILEVLIGLFCDRAFQLARRGLPRQYIGFENDLPVLRGRLDIRRQFTTLAAAPGVLACRYDELSPDIELNRIVKATVVRLGRLARSRRNQARLAELRLIFAEVTDVPRNRLAFDRVILDRSNLAWRELLSLARLLLENRFQTTSHGEAQGFALLFEMNTLFEQYVAVTLRRALAGLDFRVTLQSPKSYALVEEDTGRKRFQTIPDIVVSRRGRIELIIDTKWKRLQAAIDDPKRGVSSADVYQLLAYAQTHDAPRLMLLYPHHRRLDRPAGLQADHRIVGTERRLGVSTVDLSDLSRVSSALRGLVLSYFDAPTKEALDAAADEAHAG